MTDRDLMKQALDALYLPGELDRVNAVIPALRERLAQPEQEPVAWMFQHGETGRMSFVSNDGMNNPELFLKMNPRYALVCALVTPPAAQPAMFGPMGTVGDLFDKHVIANGNLKKEWIVYLEKNT